VRIILLLLGVALVHAQEYDLLPKGGHVIDPKNKISGRRDVAIKDGRIAAVAAEIPAARAAKTVNVAGLYITPGLVDLYVHVYAGTGTAYTGPSSVGPDDHSFRSGVTTMVDMLASRSTLVMRVHPGGATSRISRKLLSTRPGRAYWQC
jgi:dihydroorotase